MSKTPLPHGTRIRLINQPAEFEGKVGTILDEPLVWGENQYFLLDEPVGGQHLWHCEIRNMRVLAPASYRVHDKNFADAIAHATVRAARFGKPVKVEISDT